MSGLSRYRWFKCEAKECRDSFCVDKLELREGELYACRCGRRYQWDGRRMRIVHYEHSRNGKAAFSAR
jgi:hypothetical protein